MSIKKIKISEDKNVFNKVQSILEQRFEKREDFQGIPKPLVICYFVNGIDEKQAESIIGFENFIAKYPESFECESEILGTYTHDMYGILTDDKMLIPKTSSYRNFNIN
tara:strand:+ start:474 stop:797 length:324 start_codon:yes stop_codon:yes gene_type:complete